MAEGAQPPPSGRVRRRRWNDTLDVRLSCLFIVILAMVSTGRGADAVWLGVTVGVEPGNAEISGKKVEHSSFFSYAKTRGTMAAGDADVEKTLLTAIHAMDGSVGFDAVIICTSNIAQEKYWQARLEKTAGKTAREGALVLAVHEDWGDGGAGNGLGTLYAYTKARAKAKDDFKVDLDDEIAKGWSVAIYHTAGKGTRLAPLPGSENNNKPGVKLPSMLTIDGDDAELTILEAVIKQTNSYAPHRKGRVSVFWGDQVFVPSAGINPSGSHPADILALTGPMPTEEEWKERGLEKYGLIAVNEGGDAAQVEKVSYATANELLASFGEISEVGPSLGSFSLSGALLLALLKEFDQDISAKAIKLDSDPHFWMPMTLPRDAYCRIMLSKGMTDAEASAHFDRMTKFVSEFKHSSGHNRGMLGCINAGNKCYWWDYGLLKLFASNNLLVTKDSVEANALRTFLRIETRGNPPAACKASVDKTSVVMGCALETGNIKSSVCCTVTTGDIDVEGCVLINVTAKKIRARNAILYNVVDTTEGGLDLPDGAVRADVFMPGRDKLELISSKDTDGGNVWKERIMSNEMSFEEVYNANGAVDIIDAQAMAKQAKAAAK